MKRFTWAQIFCWKDVALLPQVLTELETSTTCTATGLHSFFFKSSVNSLGKFLGNGISFKKEIKEG